MPAVESGVLGVLAAVVLLAGGTTLGTTLPDPEVQRRVLALADEKASVESERDSVRSDYDSIETRIRHASGGHGDKEAKVRRGKPKSARPTPP